MPMGLTYAPRSFEYIIPNLFANMWWFIRVYIDDIIMHHANPEEHLEYLILFLMTQEVYSAYQATKLLQTRLILLGYAIDE